MILIKGNKYLTIFGKVTHSRILSNSRLLYTGERFFSDSPSPCDSKHYNIIISGGGMVGFAMACSLGKSKRLTGQKILLLEQTPNKNWKLPEEFSNRVCALSGHTIRLFSKLGVWDHIKSMRAQPVRNMQIWESCSEAAIAFDKNDANESLAHIVENDVILNSIKSQIPDNVEVLYKSTVESYELPKKTDRLVEINLKSGETLTSDLLIGADGFNSLVRKTMGAKYIHWNYDQMGIVATLELSEECDNNTAWQRFLHTGPIALLPLNKTHSSLVWSVSKEKAAVLSKLSDEHFIEALNESLWDEQRVDKIASDVHERWKEVLNVILPHTGGGIQRLPPSISKVIPGTRASFPLGLGHSVHYVAPRVALIGDAAHRVHPLAGQGVNLGFGDVDCLTNTIQEAILLGTDIGDEEVLYKFESNRQKHNLNVMAAVEGLYRLYSTTLTPLVILRSIGLSTINALHPIKKQIMNIADG